MSNITPEYFTTLFDEFKNVPSAKLTAYIDIASCRVPECIWGKSTKYATALLAAHMIASGGGAGGVGGGAGGALTAEATADLSRGYGATSAVAGSGDAELALTRYGALFIELRRETLVSATITGPNIALPNQFYPGGYYIPEIGGC
jgi:hypothetical protein